MLRNQEDFHHLHAGLTVRMIATRRDQFVCCTSRSSLRTVAMMNVEKFDHMPVVDEVSGSQHVVGVVRLSNFFDSPAPDVAVGGAMDALGEQHLIGAEASILSFMTDADQRPFRFLVSHDGIVGLVSLSDLQWLPVRATLFGLVTGLEMAMTDAILREDPEQARWRTLMSAKRRLDMEDRISKARSKGGIVNELLFTEFCDKREILRKSVFYEHPRRNWLAQALKRIEELRNKLAHANDYAESDEKAADVCRVVRDILEAHRVISEANARV